MSDMPADAPSKQEKSLAGTKIAVLIEDLYIPEEIQAYQDHFGAMGAQVDLITRSWSPAGEHGVKVFYSDEISTLETDREKLRRAPTEVTVESVEVDLDIVNDKLKPTDYAAVLMAANYTSVRLRMFDRDNGASPDSAPAVRFFAEAMRCPTVVKGALCHGLWILTPLPELLRGRRVICHEVVHADVVNAGALIEHTKDRSAEGGRPVTGYASYKVVIDGDLVTGYSKHEAIVTTDDPEGKDRHLIPPYIRAIAKQILAFRNRVVSEPVRRTVSTSDSQVILRSGNANRKILVVLSEWGYWGEELVWPLKVFDDASYQIDFATPRGGRPVALAPSTDSTFVDLPLDKRVVDEQVAEWTRRVDGKMDKQRPVEPWERFLRALDHPISLAAKFSCELPYWSDPNHLRHLEHYYCEREASWSNFVTDYDALLIVGGSGPMVDLANNQRVHDLILGFLHQGKPIAAECYGVACLAFARELDTRKSIIWGKHVTGHCREYDWKDKTGFAGTDLNFGTPFYPLEYILRDATGPEGGYHGNYGRDHSVIVDYPFITGRSTQDSKLTAEMLVKVLEDGLRSYGWCFPAKYADSEAINRGSEPN